MAASCNLLSVIGTDLCLMFYEILAKIVFPTPKFQVCEGIFWLKAPAVMLTTRIQRGQFITSKHNLSKG